MNAPVNALAVIDRDRAHAEAYRLAHGYADASLADATKEGAEARAAVAELLDSLPALIDVAAGRKPVSLGVIRRAEAALARCGK